DRRYLYVKACIHACLFTLVALPLAIFLSIINELAFVLLGAFLILIIWWVPSLYRFTISSDCVRTEKPFSAHLDVTTPSDVIQGISVYEGVIEAIVGVGTIEISTASSHGGHAHFVWPHLAGHRELARQLQMFVKANRS